MFWLLSTCGFLCLALSVLVEYLIICCIILVRTSKCGCNLETEVCSYALAEVLYWAFVVFVFEDGGGVMGGFHDFSD